MVIGLSSFNIDINKGIKIKLKGIINLDESFIEKFKDGEYATFDFQLNVENEPKENKK